MLQAKSSYSDRFGPGIRGRRPIHEELALAIAGNEALLALVTFPRSKRQLNLILASLHKILGHVLDCAEIAHIIMALVI